MFFFFKLKILFSDSKVCGRRTAHDFIHLYENVMLIQRDKLSRDANWEDEVEKVGHQCLKPILRRYQKESVAWMLRQERRKSNADSFSEGNF